MEKEKLKELLEDTARESGLKIKGKIVELKTPEQREAEKEFQDWKKRKSEVIIKTSQTELDKEFLKLVLNGKIHSLLCISKTGYGKTYTTINFLKDVEKEFSYKSGSAVRDLGCSVKCLKEHLESLFYKHPGSGLKMSWDNYGEWHIDHIKPCSKFDLTIDSEQRECFHYTNLQPLWAEDNLRKSDKYE